jgi:hypothetical protein
VSRRVDARCHVSFRYSASVATSVKHEQSSASTRSEAERDYLIVRTPVLTPCLTRP